MTIVIGGKVSLRQVRIDGVIIPEYGMTVEGDVFKHDSISGSWIEVEATKAFGAKVPTRVNINNTSHSNVTLYKETFKISKSHAYRRIKKRDPHKHNSIEYKGTEIIYPTKPFPSNLEIRVYE